MDHDINYNFPQIISVESAIRFYTISFDIQIDCQTWLLSLLKWVLGLACVKLNIWTEAKQPHMNIQSYIYK